MSDEVTEPDASARHPFSADRPIKARVDDKLGRAGFAEALGESIRGWTGDDSLVIAIYGDWGSGKTSVINLMVESLEGNAPADMEVLPFNPWEWSGNEQVANAFFSEIGRLLGRANQQGAAARAWRRYAAAIGAAKATAHAFSPLVLAIVGILGAVGIGIAFLDTEVLRWAVRVGGGLVLALVFLAWRSDMAAVAIADALDRSAGEQQTLPELKADLRKALADYPKTILVIVDDVDRLTGPEVLRVMQLIKANADLPKMVYLLALHREQVARCIEAELRSESGMEWIEKIVQVGFDLPLATGTEIEQMLFDGINAMLKEFDGSNRFDNARFFEVYRPGLRPYFETPRDVQRFLSSLHFVFGRHYVDGILNVDPVDLMSLEAIRIFEPALHKSLARSKSLVTTGGSLWPSDRDEGKRAALVALLDSAVARTSAEAIVRGVFPHADATIRGQGYGEDSDATYRTLKARHPQVFDRYFALAIPPGDLSEAEMRAVFESAKDGPAQTVALLRDLCSSGRIGRFLAKARAQAAELDRGITETLIGSLFEIDDCLSDESNLDDLVSDALRANFLISDLLENLAENDRKVVMQRAIEQTDRVFLPGYFLSLDLHRHEDRRPGPTIADLSALEALRNLVLERIKALAANGTLAQQPHLGSLIGDWRRWGAESDVSAWASSAVRRPANTAPILRAFQTVRTSRSPRPLFSLDQLEKVLPLDVADRAAWEALQSEELNDEHRQVLTDFVQALEADRGTGYDGRIDGESIG